MSGIERRLERLEDVLRPEPEDEHAREELRRKIRQTAEHINHCRDPKEPLFEITEEGDVLCAHDGKPVTTWPQTGAEQFYWMEVEWGGPGLVHDEERAAFYTPDGELALSREYMDLRHLMGPVRGEGVIPIG